MGNMPDRTTTRPRIWMILIALAAVVGTAAPAGAQGFGVGMRMAWVTSDVLVEVDKIRFIGGQIRLGSGRVGLEVAIDRRSETLEAFNQKIVETPIQTSLILRMAKGKIAPFLLVGPGWYRRRVEAIDGPDLTLSTTEFGWHAGGGLEVRPARHFGIHGDYRYTFLDFNNDDDIGGIVGGVFGKLLPGHKGSMWTFGGSFYF
jgi:hypothetical protein